MVMQRNLAESRSKGPNIAGIPIWVLRMTKEKLEALGLAVQKNGVYASQSIQVVFENNRHSEYPGDELSKVPPSLLSLARCSSSIKNPQPLRLATASRPPHLSINTADPLLSR